MTSSRTERAPAPRRRASSHPLLKHLRLPAPKLEEGTTRMEFTVEPIHLRRGGIVHGGMYATVLDTVVGYAAYHAAPPGTDVVTMQLNINMTAPAKAGDRIIATARPVHVGRRTTVVQGELRRGDGALLATGSATLFFLEERSR